MDEREAREIWLNDVIARYGRDAVVFASHPKLDDFQLFSSPEPMPKGQALIDAATQIQQRHEQERRAAEVKAECKRRIYAVLSAETQMNATAFATTVAAKAASARTVEEKNTLAAVQAALAWVDQMRATAATLLADPAADFKADAAWPAQPAEVAQLAQRF